MTLHNSEGIEKEIKVKAFENLNINSIIEEHNDFSLSIKTNKSPKVPFETGRDALKLAIKILDEINKK